MSVITSVSVQNKTKNRCNVFIDGEFAFAVYIELAIKYGLKKDFVLEDKLKEEILEEDGRLYAFSLGTKYVSRAVKTRKQVFTYLQGKGFSDKVIYYALKKMEEYGFIDDKEYVRRYLETYSSSQGKRLADYKLMTKGVKKVDIESVRENFDDNAKESAKLIAEKRLKNKELSRENLQKTYRYIVGKGFSYEDAEYAISFFKEKE